MTTPYFTQATLRFLTDLSLSNHRSWFERHRDEYETLVREPALRLIRDFAPHLAKISRHFVAADRKVGGSLMRVHRDVRFSGDKSPYKTNIGIQFRHEAGKDVHAPGFYFHVEPGQSFLGAGLWRPEAPALARIRARIVEQPKKWRTAAEDRAFRRHFELGGDSLKRPPRGFEPTHPLIVDLMRTDHIASQPLRDAEIVSARLPALMATAFASSRPYVAFLCAALGLPC
jgi:uncharacterized protein (TIGR02453 family)